MLLDRYYSGVAGSLKTPANPENSSFYPLLIRLPKNIKILNPENSSFSPLLIRLPKNIKILNWNGESCCEVGQYH